MKGQSSHAYHALKGLHHTNHLNGIIRGCIWDPQLGSRGQHPNAVFFGEVEWYLTCRQIAYAGDTFNTYCQNILAEILAMNPQLWKEVSKHLRPKNDAEDAIGRLRIQRQLDGYVREALRDTLGISWCNEIEIICELRNKIVHQAGFDPEGEVAGKVKEFPPGKYWLPPAGLNSAEVPLDCGTDGKLIIDARTAHWATLWVAHHIHQMDQCICHRFGVARVKRPPLSSTFHMREGAHPQILFPGMPLPKAPDIPAPAVAPPLPELPPYDPMANPKEKACADAWHRIQNELDAIVRRVCDEAAIEIQGIECNLAGHPLGHTIVNHEIHLGYQLGSPDPACTRSNRVGIRIRQNDFDPFVTIWSTKTMMKDFRNIEDLDPLEEEIVTAIHATLA